MPAYLATKTAAKTVLSSWVVRHPAGEGDGGEAQRADLLLDGGAPDVGLVAQGVLQVGRHRVEHDLLEVGRDGLLAELGQRVHSAALRTKGTPISLATAATAS